MINRLKKALGVSAVVTLYLTCFIYAWSMAVALFNQTSVIQAFVNTVVAAMFLFSVIAYALYELYSHVEERDRKLEEERKQRQKDEGKSTDQSEPSHKDGDIPPQE